MTETDLRRAGPLKVVSVPKAVAAFLVAGLVVLAVVALVLARAQQRIATAEAIRDARTLTNLEATDVVGPLLNDAALAPGPAQDQLDAIVRSRVLGSHIVRVKIWDATGTIAYSDDKTLIGKQFQLQGDELEALESGQTSAEVTALEAPENQEERQFGKLLQVYQGVSTPEGTRLLFETYQPYSVITVASRRMWETSLPVLLAGLALLYVVQAPLAYQMARRLRRSQDEREGLLLGTLAASDRERATIAADLHDGVVQGITGASFTLAAGAERSRKTDPAAAQAMDAAAGDLRRWVRELRSLVVTITPPALHAQGLGPSLIDLAATLEVRGLTTTVDVDDAQGLDETTEALLYRAAQEGVRNVVRHAEATHVDLTVVRSDDGVRLRLRDDGRGLGEQHEDARSRGHVGLELLRQLVSAQGGELTVQEADPHGTELVVRLPVATT
ncbi:MAG: integral rane sensor signal transduction histidine kinase [Frankiales bacterium]|nr:integral rane sensor signal transduction histidine kinase [Frankiales bacterium]